MRLDTEFIRLPLAVDAARLAAEVLAFPESDWRKHPQGHAGNTALPLVARGGNPDDDGVKGPMQPTPFLARCPYLARCLAALGSVLGRTRLMRIVGNGEAHAHVDTNYYWMQRTRVHFPIVTYPEVRFLCGSAELNMKPGQVWLFDTWRMHNVLNANPGARIHLVADTVGSADFWELAAHGERPFTDPPTLAAVPDRFVDASGPDPEMVFERANFPAVMSPWEIECLFADLVADLGESSEGREADAASLQDLLFRFHRNWRNLWAGHGTDGRGYPEYRRTLDALDAGIQAFAGRLALPNGVDAVEAVRQAVVRSALNPELAAVSEMPADPKFVAVESPLYPEAKPTPATFARPVVILAAPRSGSTLLFETLARSPDFWSLGGESHEIFESVLPLGPEKHGWESNRLTAADADPDTIAKLHAAFRERVVDREGNRLPADAAGVRLLEKTPKNALRIPFLAAAFPDALFVYLAREPRENVSSIVDAWNSKKFVTYPKLPGWKGSPWSLLLIPGRDKLKGKSVAEVAAAQWAAAHEQILADLAALPRDRWCGVRYEDLLANPQAVAERLCKFAGVRWDQSLTGDLPLSKHTLTPPNPDKWKKNEAGLKKVLPALEPLAKRVAEAVKAEPVAEAPSPTAAVPPTAANPKKDISAEPLRSVFTSSLAGILKELGISLLVSTYQAGKLVIVREHDGVVNTHFRNFPAPMGIAVQGNRLAVGTKNHVWEFWNQADVARKLEPVGKHDACFLARSTHTTGDIRIHEIAFGEKDLWIVNTRFSCLCTLDPQYSFVPQWRPKFVTALAPEDRCHLNGMCLAGTPAKPKYVTCLGATDTVGGWRENKKDGGLLLDVDSGEVVARGLSMPHSPRLHQGKLFVLESGVGGIGTVDLKTGKVESIATLPGFTRGIDFAGPFAFIGLSQVRETAVFSGIPITETLAERTCGVWVVDLRSGKVAGFLRFESGVEEIFAVQVLHGSRYPDVIADEEQWLANSFVLPEEALRAVPAEMRTK